jgi:two-component system, cell cycle response regulator DivK
MIVEDNELNMKLFHDLLEAYGYRTIGTRHGFEVVDLARKRRPDLILMDIQLPEVSGLEVTKWLKEDPELQAIPVVAVTAFAMEGDEEQVSVTWINLLGYAASATVLAAFCMNTMIPLRLTAILSNILFASFGLKAHIYPVLILHVILLPVNTLRLIQIRRVVTPDADRAHCSFK